MSRKFVQRLTAIAGAAAVSTWLAASPLAAQEKQDGGKKDAPAAAAPKADAPKADAPKADTPSAAPSAQQQQQQAPRPSAQSQGPQRPPQAQQAPQRPPQAQQAPQRPQTGPARPADRAADRASQATDEARDRAADQADRARDAARDTKDAAKDTARDAKDTAKDTARDAKDTARDARDTARDARDNAQDAARDAADRTARPDADRGPTRHETNRAFSSDRDRDRGDRDGDRDRDRGDRDRGDRDRHHHRAFTKVGININVGNNGLAITNVFPNTVFAGVGFRTGDVLVSVGGRRFTDTVVFYDWLRTVQPGQRVAFVVMRGGQEQTLYWTPTEQFVQEFTSVIDEGAPAAGDNFLGIHLDPQVQDAAIVADVDPNSPAHRAGVRRNDAIDSVNGQQVSNPDDFAAATSQLPPGEAVQMTVSRLMNLQIVPGGGAASQTTIQRQETYVNPGVPANPAPAAVPVQPGPPAVAPAPRPQVPVAQPQQQPQQRGGLFRRR